MRPLVLGALLLAGGAAFAARPQPSPATVTSVASDAAQARDKDKDKDKDKDDEAACDLRYELTPRHDTAPRRLDVLLTFPAEGRSRTDLRLQPSWAGVDDFASMVSGWSAADASDRPAIRIEATDRPERWRVAHPADGRVQVRYQVRAALPDPDDGRPQPQEQLYRTQLGRDWFQLFGHGVFPAVETWGDQREGRFCVEVRQTPGRAGPLIGSDFHALPDADGRAEVRLRGTQAMLRHAVLAGGPGWRVVEPIPGVRVATRSQPGWDLDGFAQAAAAVIESHRRFWRDHHATSQAILVTPNHGLRNYGGTLVRNAAALHVPQGFDAGHPAFALLLAHEHLHRWIPNRLGGRPGDDATGQYRHFWLSEGFTHYYTHRLMLSSGHWTLGRYAEELTDVLRRYWRSPARNATAQSIAPRFFSDPDAGQQLYARGEFLAMRWDRALLERGHSGGLDDLLRGLLLPEDVARRGEPAHVRVLRALALRLNSRAPLEDVDQVVMKGRDMPLDERLAGPCFRIEWTGAEGDVERQPRMTVRPGAADDASCRAWVRVMPTS